MIIPEDAGEKPESKHDFDTIFEMANKKSAWRWRWLYDEDLIEEGFASAIEYYYPRILNCEFDHEPAEKVVNILVRQTGNACVSIIRKENTRRVYEEQLHMEAQMHMKPTDVEKKCEVDDLFKRAVKEHLNKEQATIVQMDIDGYKPAEIAAELGKSIDSVYKARSRAYARLRRGVKSAEQFAEKMRKEKESEETSMGKAEKKDKETGQTKGTQKAKKRQVDNKKKVKPTRKQPAKGNPKKAGKKATPKQVKKADVKKKATRKSLEKKAPGSKDVPKQDKDKPQDNKSSSKKTIREKDSAEHRARKASSPQTKKANKSLLR